MMGSDERKGQNIGHSDSMMLMHVDLTKNQFQAVSIPRDTRVHLEGYGYTKLTSIQYIMQAKKGAKKGAEALKGIAKKALSPSNVTNLPSLVKSIPNFILATNMSNTDMLSLGVAVKGFDPNKQLTYHQIHGVGKTMYDDILKANNSQIVIDQQQINDIFSKYF
jgi:anionic cell wall polymer biosynthesis LytR-Cps2A-Psr (LCP) family protein